MKTETLEKEITDFKEELAERDQRISDLMIKIEELKKEINDLEEEIYEGDSLGFKDSFNGIEEIKYETTGNIIDDELMETLAEALEKHTPLQIIERLKF